MITFLKRAIFSLILSLFALVSVTSANAQTLTPTPTPTPTYAPIATPTPTYQPTPTPTPTLRPTFTPIPTYTPTPTPIQPISYPVTPTPTPIKPITYPVSYYSYQLSGRVTNLISKWAKRINIFQPAANVKITATNVTTGQKYISYTNSQGNYSMTLPSGYYYLSASGGKSWVYLPKVVYVSLNQSVANLNFVGTR